MSIDRPSEPIPVPTEARDRPLTQPEIERIVTTIHDRHGYCHKIVADLPEPFDQQHPYPASNYGDWRWRWLTSRWLAVDECLYREFNWFDPVFGLYPFEYVDVALSRIDPDSPWHGSGLIRRQWARYFDHFIATGDDQLRIAALPVYKEHCHDLPSFAEHELSRGLYPIHPHTPPEPAVSMTGAEFDVQLRGGTLRQVLITRGGTDLVWVGPYRYLRGNGRRPTPRGNEFLLPGLHLIADPTTAARTIALGDVRPVALEAEAMNTIATAFGVNPDLVPGLCRLGWTMQLIPV